MATAKTRVAAYLPPHIEERFNAFKTENGLDNDSKTIVDILSSFFGVAHSVDLEVAHSDQYATVGRVEALEAKVSELLQLINESQAKIEDIVSDVKGELNSESKGELLSTIEQIEKRLKVVEKMRRKDETLATGELAERLGMASSTLSHWKNPNSKKGGKSPDELLRATREKDPDRVGWILIPEVNRFRPERELPDESPSKLQGSLTLSIV